MQNQNDTSILDYLIAKLLFWRRDSTRDKPERTENIASNDLPEVNQQEVTQMEPELSKLETDPNDTPKSVPDIQIGTNHMSEKNHYLDHKVESSSPTFLDKLSERFPWLDRVPIESWLSVFSPSGEAIDTKKPKFPTRLILIELAVIFVAVFAYCQGFLDLKSDRALPGNESEVFQSLDWVLSNSLANYGKFPLWNPYLQTGLPFVSDPMLHSFNPLVSIPVFLTGVFDGFKIGLFLSFLAAGMGMWWLGIRMGMSPPARVWSALLFAFAGPPVARFFQGQYLFVFGFAWIPWCLASMFAFVQTRRKLHASLAILSLAFLFFSGNVYYAFYMLFVIFLFVIILLVSVRRERPFIFLNKQAVKGLLILGVLTLGLIAVQLLPTVEFWPRISKATNLQLTDSQTFNQIFQDFTSIDRWREDAIQTLPSEEFYAYIGIWPFLFLLLLPFAIWKKDKRHILFFLILFAFVLAWIDIIDMPWRDLYLKSSFITQFRYPTRMLIYGAFAIIVLAGLSLDALWVIVWKKVQSSKNGKDNTLLQYLGIGLAGILVAVMLYSVRDVYATNKQIAQTRDPYPPASEVMSWLRQYDSTEYFVSTPGGWHSAVLSNGLRYLDAWYHFGDIREFSGMVNKRLVQARPNYVVTGNDNIPSFPDPIPVKQFNTHTIYKLPQSLPYAFSVINSQLLEPSSGGELSFADVTQLTPLISSPNKVEIIAEGLTDANLVILTNSYKGWSVTVDGDKGQLNNVGGYLAVDMQAGVHKYTFSYRPTSFIAGLVLSLLALAITIIFIISDLNWDWKVTKERITAFPPLAKRKASEALTWAKVYIDFQPGLGDELPDTAGSQPTTISAVYQNEVLKPEQPLELPEKTSVQIAILPKGTEQVFLTGGQRRAFRLQTFVQQLYRAITWKWMLFIIPLLIYAFTRLYALDLFPIYFFSDEASQVLFAEKLIENGFRDAQGRWFPLYFDAAANRWTPLISVYFHAVGILLFGKSILVTRGISALISILGAAAVGLILKLVLKTRSWWSGIFFLAITPAWLLHSRTSFETVMTTAFFACFMLFYLLYRTRSPNYIYPTLLFGAFTFYSYSNAQVVIGMAGLFLLISDFRYHLSHKRILFRGFIFGVILLIPFLSFNLNQPSGLSNHLRMVDSYIFHDIPLGEKISTYLGKHLYGISPGYWFFTHTRDLPRHRMKDMGNILIQVLPLFLLGVGLSFWRIKSPKYRSILLAALSAPAGAALLDVGIARVLVFVIPAAIFAALGLEILISFLERFLSRKLLTITAFIILAYSSFSLLRTALVDGPLWFTDYGLYGMQYGAKQLFVDALPEYLDENPNVKINMTPTWANGTDVFVRFFYSEELWPRVIMRTITDYLYERRNLDHNTVLVMTPAELNQAQESHKFKTVDIDQVIDYPDGSPGFYFVRLEYADNVDQILAEEKAERQKLDEDIIELDGQLTAVRYSRIDAGQLSDGLDGDSFTLFRGLEANPFIIEFDFPEPRTLSSLEMVLGSMDFTLTAYLYAVDADEPIIYAQSFRDQTNDPHIEMSFNNGPSQVSKIRIEVLNLLSGDSAKIHVRELKLH